MTKEITGNARTEFINANHPILTLDKARALAGKKIRWTHPVYEENRQSVYESIIDEIISMYDLASREPAEGYASRADYWDKKLSPKMVEEYKNTLCILDADGSDTYMRCLAVDGWFKEPTFHCSDADRAVFYEVID